VETGSAKLYPHLWIVRCSQEAQVARLMSRKACDRETAERWISSQMDMEEKVQHASTIIENDGTISDLQKTVKAAWDGLRAQLKDRG
jgi:dephospho-CoA kinase